MSLVRLKWISGNRTKTYARMLGDEVGKNVRYSKDYMCMYLSCVEVETLPGTGNYRLHTGVTVAPAERYRIEMYPVNVLSALTKSVRCFQMLDEEDNTELYVDISVAKDVDIATTFVGSEILRIFLVG